MFSSYRSKERLHLFRAHVCTLAVAVSYNSLWRVPRDAFRYGGLTYMLTHTVAMTIVALPVTLLQLSIGQLCQQDAVGMWRAVPFFKGVGYLRLLISFLGSVYTLIYMGLTVTYFLYTISKTIPFWECTESTTPIPDAYENDVLNSSICSNGTFMAPINEQPEYYISMALIIIALWIVFPFVLYNPVKFMKRIFYTLFTPVLLLAIIIVSCIGDTIGISSFQKKSDWRYFLEPNIWHGALTQSLWSSQIAGGFILSASDSIYSNMNVQWSALVFIGVNVAFSWFGALFWFGVSGRDEKDTSAAAVLLQIYTATEEKALDIVWPLLTFATLFLSGIITMLSLLYPLYERFRVIGGQRWRIIAIVNSVIGVAITLAVLAGNMTAIDLLEDTIVPLLVCLTTIVEISAFIFIYGWKILVEDVEFLSGRKLGMYWIMGWCAAPGIITPFTIWWLIMVIVKHTDWTEPPYEASTLLATVVMMLLVLISFACVTVARQVQYDLFGKLKSSFKPSRHWGPRDPITHYYWLARREEVDRGNLPRTVYHRRHLGQLSGQPIGLNISDAPIVTKDMTKINLDKKRANSDDWLYTVYRRHYLRKAYREYLAKTRRRSKSFDLTIVPSSKMKNVSTLEQTGIADSKEDNNYSDIRKTVKFRV